MRNLLADPSVALLYLCFLLALAKFATGTWRAWANGVFELTALKAWVRDESGHLLPILIWIVLAKAIGFVDLSSIGSAFGIDPSTMTALGGGGLMIFAGLQAATYIASTFADIKNNLAPPDPGKLAAKVEKAARKGDPIPGSNPIPPTP